MASKVKFSLSTWAIVILLIAVILDANIRDLVSPFWQQQQSNPLMLPILCAEQFKPKWNETTRLGYFYQQPQKSTFFADNRSARQLQLQYALAPHILDSRPEMIQVSPWVIGYFENEKTAESEAQTLAPELGLEVELACGQYILFRRVN